jgi:hypothetical protein
MSQEIKQKRLWNNTARYENAIDQSVKLIARLSTWSRQAGFEIDKALKGKNNVDRAVGVRDADTIIKKINRETLRWHEVINAMHNGKDVHSSSNGGCKGAKLEIVAGSEYEFGQYLIDQNTSTSNGDSSQANGKAYIERVTKPKFGGGNE